MIKSIEQQKISFSDNEKLITEKDHEEIHKYEFDIVNEGVDERLKFYNVCCSQGGCL